MKKNQFGLSLVALLIAVISWIGVVYLAWNIYSMQANRGVLVRRAQQAETLKTIAARTHAVLQETASERTILLNTSKVDVLSVVNAIESVGTLAGVKLQVSGAQPAPEISGKSGGATVRPINFAIQVDGAFAGVMYAVQLLETLPFPTDITQLEIGRAQLETQGKSASAPWHVNANVRLFTTAELSS